MITTVNQSRKRFTGLQAISAASISLGILINPAPLQFLGDSVLAGLGPVLAGVGVVIASAIAISSVGLYVADNHRDALVSILLLTGILTAAFLLLDKFFPDLHLLWLLLYATGLLLAVAAEVRRVLGSILKH